MTLQFRRTSHNLINEEPLLVLPTVAWVFGLDEAVFIQRVHRWLQTSKHEYDGRVWIYNRMPDWLEQMPFFTARTLWRIIKNLEELGVLHVSDEYNKSGSDRTKWYALDMEKLDEIVDIYKAARETDEGLAILAKPIAKMAKHRAILASHRAKMANSYKETTTLTQKTITTGGEASAQPTQGTPPAAAPPAPPAPAAYADTEAQPPPEAEVEPEPKPQKKPKPPSLAEHPLVAAYRELCERNPNRVQMKLIIERNPPLDKWVRAIRTWAGRGHNITNIEGILDWAENPERMARQSGKRKGNSLRDDHASDLQVDDAELEAAKAWARQAYPDRFNHDDKPAPP